MRSFTRRKSLSPLIIALAILLGPACLSPRDSSDETTDATSPSTTSDSSSTETDETNQPFVPPRQDELFGPPPAFAIGEQRIDEPFPGVRIVSRTTEEPRRLSYHVVLIAPDTDGLEWVVTPPNAPDVSRMTTKRTTRQFVRENELQLGINAHFFTPWPPEGPSTANLLGLAVSDGEAYSPFRNGYRWAFAEFDDGEVGFVRWDREAEEVASDHPEYGFLSDPDRPIRNAVGGGDMLVRDGSKNRVNRNSEEPRTVIGLRDDSIVLFLLVDGRQDNHSLGMNLDELADVMLEFGASDALNMDGGGSTTLVVADPVARVYNRPIGYLFSDTERHNGSNIGLRLPTGNVD